VHILFFHDFEWCGAYEGSQLRRNREAEKESVRRFAYENGRDNSAMKFKEKVFHVIANLQQTMNVSYTTICEMHSSVAEAHNTLNGVRDNVRKIVVFMDSVRAVSNESKIAVAVADSSAEVRKQQDRDIERLTQALNKLRAENAELSEEVKEKTARLNVGSYKDLYEKVWEHCISLGMSPNEEIPANKMRIINFIDHLYEEK
jgi:hypothetical protein